eukprot:3931700-Rhodomonas_salina.1
MMNALRTRDVSSGYRFRGCVGRQRSSPRRDKALPSQPGGGASLLPPGDVSPSFSSADQCFAFAVASPSIGDPGGSTMLLCFFNSRADFVLRAPRPSWSKSSRGVVSMKVAGRLDANRVASIVGTEVASSLRGVTFASAPSLPPPLVVLPP